MKTEPGVFDIRKRGWRNYQEWEAWHRRNTEQETISSIDQWLPGYECLEDDYSEDSMP